MLLSPKKKRRWIPLSIEEREEIRSKAWRDNAPDLAAELVALFLAFFSKDFDPVLAHGMLTVRGLTVTEATAVLARVTRLIGDH